MKKPSRWTERPKKVKANSKTPVTPGESETKETFQKTTKSKKNRTGGPKGRGR